MKSNHPEQVPKEEELHEEGERADDQIECCEEGVTVGVALKSGRDGRSTLIPYPTDKQSHQQRVGGDCPEQRGGHEHA